MALVAAYGAFESNRSGAVSSAFTSGRPASSAASVPTCTSRLTPASAQARSTFRVPPTFTRMNSARGPHDPSAAAAWKASSQPSAPARIAAASSRLPRTGSAPASSTAAAARSLRASARMRRPPEARRRTSAPPMKPDPPVTKTSGTAQPYPPIGR